MSDFSLSITLWYRQNKRNLPWRKTNDPYRIWLSEIILQQTRVEQGRSYYLKFIDHYPTVNDLADAGEQEILNDWQGLGYYNRARNLHAAARHIRDNFSGNFPDSYEDIRQLKGIGDYTAAAISSFAFGIPKAVVDGNVYRLLSRCFDIDIPIDSTAGKKYFQKLADSLLDPSNPGEHNQAIMELGALVCSPSPDCSRCPLQNICLAKQHNTISQRPVKSRRAAVRDRYFHYFLFHDGSRTVLEKRIEKDIWQHLYQFPLLELPDAKTRPIQKLIETAAFSSEEIVHLLSHQRIHAVFHHFDTLPEVPESHWIVVKTEELQDYPLPRIIDRYLENNPPV